MHSNLCAMGATSTSLPLAHLGAARCGLLLLGLLLLLVKLLLLRLLLLRLLLLSLQLLGLLLHSCGVRGRYALLLLLLPDLAHRE